MNNTVEALRNFALFSVAVLIAFALILHIGVWFERKEPYQIEDITYWSQSKIYHLKVGCGRPIYVVAPDSQAAIKIGRDFSPGNQEVTSFHEEKRIVLIWNQSPLIKESDKSNE